MTITSSDGRAWAVGGEVVATMYDFGAVSIAYTIPISCDLSALQALSEALHENPDLLADAKARKFDYTRSDGSTFTLTVGDVLDRKRAFEMTYNPNDCVELRWGAPEGSAELAPCQRRAPTAQVRLMESYRSWFAKRRRPGRE